MTRLLRGCVACVRNSRSHTDNLRRVFPWLFVLVFAAAAEAQVQVDLKFKRLQYIAYEPVVATVAITNLAGRDIELHDANGQSWLGFEITGSEEQPIAPLSGANREAPLRIQAGQRVTRQINLTPLYPVNEFGAYHVRQTFTSRIWENFSTPAPESSKSRTRDRSGSKPLEFRAARPHPAMCARIR